MPSCSRAVRLCGLAAAVSPTAAASIWPAVDELAMVQSTVELSALDVDVGAGQQLPGMSPMAPAQNTPPPGLMPVSSMPQVNVTMDGLIPTTSDMTPVVETIKQMDDMLNAFRNDKVYSELQGMAGNVSKAMLSNWDEYLKRVRKLTATTAANAVEAGARVAEMVLQFEEAAREANNITKDAAEPIAAKLGHRLPIDRLLDTALWLNGPFNNSFNHSIPTMDVIMSHRNGTRTEMGDEDCEMFGKMMTHMSFCEKYDQSILDYITNNINGSDKAIITSAFVIQAPDVITKFQRWAHVTGQAYLEMGAKYVEVSKEVSALSMQLLNGVAGCNIDEAKVEKADINMGAASGLRPTILALPLALLAAALAWAGF